MAYSSPEIIQQDIYSTLQINEIDPAIKNHIAFIPAYFTTSSGVVVGLKLSTISPKINAKAGKQHPLTTAATKPIVIKIFYFELANFNSSLNDT